VAVAVALVGGDGHVGLEIDVDGDGSHSIIPGRASGSAMPLSEGGITTDKVATGGRLETPKNPGVCTLLRKNPETSCARRSETPR